MKINITNSNKLVPIETLKKGDCFVLPGTTDGELYIVTDPNDYLLSRCPHTYVYRLDQALNWTVSKGTLVHKVENVKITGSY